MCNYKTSFMRALYKRRSKIHYAYCTCACIAQCVIFVVAIGRDVENMHHHGIHTGRTDNACLARNADAGPTYPSPLVLQLCAYLISDFSASSPCHTCSPESFRQPGLIDCFLFAAVAPFNCFRHGTTAGKHGRISCSYQFDNKNAQREDRSQGSDS